MANVLDGQLSALDLLEPPRATVRPAATIWWRMTEDRPTPETPWHCTACGHEITTWFGFIAHNGATPHDGPRICGPMHMARTHIKARVSLILRTLAGEDAFYCCMHADHMHGREIANPSAMQHADHLRVEINRARDTWGVRAHAFDEWLGPYLIEQRVFRYSLDPAEYPEEFAGDLAAAFTVHLSSTFPAQPCGYCGRELTAGEGNGGGVQKLADGRKCRWMICHKCAGKHGRPDISTHPNLKVTP